MTYNVFGGTLSLYTTTTARLLEELVVHLANKYQ